jgi:hypothetical protein
VYERPSGGQAVRSVEMRPLRECGHSRSGGDVLLAGGQPVFAADQAVLAADQAAGPGSGSGAGRRFLASS